MYGNRLCVDGRKGDLGVDVGSEGGLLAVSKSVTPCPLHSCEYWRGTGLPIRVHFGLLHLWVNKDSSLGQKLLGTSTSERLESVII